MYLLRGPSVRSRRIQTRAEQGEEFGDSAQVREDREEEVEEIIEIVNKVENLLVLLLTIRYNRI